MAIPVTANWIVSKENDLLWFIGSTVTSYLLLYCHFGLDISALWIWWFWVLFFDGPHIFGTLVRTYLDREEWAARGPLLLWSLLIFAIGPMTILLGNIYDTMLFFAAFHFVFLFYQWWHILRQHYGFMVLYQKKNGEPAGKTNNWDYWFFHVIMLVPYFSVLLQNKSFRSRLSMGADLGSIEQLVVYLLNFLTVLILSGYLIREVRQVFAHKKKLNVPKWLLFIAVLPFPVVASFTFIGYESDYLLLAAVATIYHNIQYHGIVWFYAKNRYQSDTSTLSAKRFGLASIITSRFVYYYAAGLLFTLLYRFSSEYLELLNVSIGDRFEMRDLVVTFVLAVSLHHFYLDQKNLESS